MKLLTIIMYIGFLANAALASENRLSPFSTDGCSMSPDRNTFTHSDWSECCVSHDKKYWLGGTHIEREMTDIKFKECLETKGMNSIESEIFYQSVRYGGTAKIATSWRWGYGWKVSRGYQALSEIELKEVAEYLSPVDLQIIQEYSCLEN